jgi:DNA-binding transcriptional MerR regulator
MLPRKETFGSQEVCRILQISSRQLDYWVLIGVVQPILEPHGRKIFRRFTSDDLFFLKHVKDLTDEGFLVSKAAEKVRTKAYNLFLSGENKNGWTG